MSPEGANLFKSPKKSLVVWSVPMPVGSTMPIWPRDPSRFRAVSAKIA
jgi:hypothetical protein